MYEENDDGYFVAARVKGETKSIRTKDFQTFLAFIKKLPQEIESYALHARLAARGEASSENIHGWIEKGFFVYHNGVLTSCGNSKVSDTIAFARKLKKIDLHTIKKQLYQETGGGAIFFTSFDLKHSIIAAIEHPVHVYVANEYVVYASKADVHCDLPEKPETLLFYVPKMEKFGVLEFVSSTPQQVKIPRISKPRMTGAFNNSIVEVRNGIPVQKEFCFTRRIEDVYFGRTHRKQYGIDYWEGGDF